MKQKYFLKILLVILLFSLVKANAQSTGDIAFVGFNADGNKDFAIVALVDITANSIIYFSDNEPNSTGNSFVSSTEGILKWDSGATLIKSGTIISFNDLTNATNRKVSIGSIVATDGSINLSASGDALFAVKTTADASPENAANIINWLAGIQNSTSTSTSIRGDLTNTGLNLGTTFVVFANSGNPDGGKYTGPDFGENTFSSYLPLIGDYKNWKIESSNGENILDSNEFTFNNFSIINATWNGNTDNDWNTASNWTPASVPTTTSDILIPNGLTNYPTVSSAKTIKAISIESGASLVANATVTGSAIYKRILTDKWHLVSSPVNGETFQNLITNHTFATGTAGGRIGIAPYKNDGTKWDYQTNSSTGNIDKATGLSVKLAAAGTLKFTGTINNVTTNKAITKNTNGFNLIGNPFTSYINSGTLLTDNSAILESQTIWLWNGTSYETKVTADNFSLAPGQGFFIEAKAGGGNVSFNTTYQSHQTTDTFLRGVESKSEIHISAKNNGKESIAKIYYIDGATEGFDNGFDGEVFGGISYNFSLASQLVSMNKGKNFAIQSLPKNLIEETVIPLSLKAKAGNTIEFSSKSINLPSSNLNIYIEDKLNNKIIDITTKNYTHTLKNNKNGAGQFYLRVSSKNINLSTPIATTIADVNLYKSATETITIAGLQTKNASLKMYSLTGKQVFNKTFNSNGYSNITIPKLATGIYIIELTSDLGKINKKIILE